MKEHFLTLFRRKETNTVDFRLAADRLASLLAQEVASHADLKPHQIHTPLAETIGATFEHPVVLVPILPPFLELFPKATVGFIGI